MKYVQSNHIQYRPQLIKLYIESFSEGISGQYIDENELNKYIDMILQEGFVYLALDEFTISGALLSYPLKYDNAFPENYRVEYNTENSLYIAEMMVTENSRGKGLGSGLLDFFFKSIDKTKFTNIFIRVWDKNIPALKLYQKFGFKEIARIKQHKKKSDGYTPFVMNKIYLHKKLNLL